MLPAISRATSVEFEYGLNLMEGIQVRQTYAGIMIGTGQVLTDRTRFLLRETDQKELRRNKIMTFSYKYRLWPIKPRLYNWTLKDNILTSRDMLPVFNIGRQFSFFALNDVPRGRRSIRSTPVVYPGWEFEFDFSPLNSGRYELIYGTAEVALQFYKVHDVKVVIDMAEDILAINIDNHKIIYRKKLNTMPNCFGFINVPITYGSSQWMENVPGLEIMDFRYHYGFNDYKTSAAAEYPRFHIDRYDRRERHLKIDSQYWLGLSHYEGSHGARKDFVEAAKHFTKAAKDDHVLAQYYLGICYYYGRGVKQSDSEAYDWFRKAARNYHDGAGFMAALMQCQGRRRHDATAPARVFISLLAPSILQGNANAFYLNLWRQTAGILPEAEILTSWSDAVRRGHPKAMLQQPGLPETEFFRRCELTAAMDYLPGIAAAGECLVNGYGTPVDFERGFELLLKAAARGSERAALLAAKCRFAGIGTARDPAAAEKMLRELEYKNNLEARLLCGLFDPVPDPASKLYLNGDKRGAFAAWSRSAEPLHQYRAGLCLAAGEGAAADPKQAFAYFARAADTGLPQACLEVANYHENGLAGTFKNSNIAFEFFRKSASYPPGALAYAQKCVGRRLGKEALEAMGFAARAGIVEAMYLYAQLQLNGLPGAPSNRENALQALLVAADNGSVEAMFDLADCYYNGIGVKSDKDQAAEWWRKYHAASDERDNNTLDAAAPYWPPLPYTPEEISVNGMPKYVSDWTDSEEIHKYYLKY